MVLREVTDVSSQLNEIAALTNERDDLLRQLQLFWRSEKRPWFCPVCTNKQGPPNHGKGYLQPFGKFNLRCADCETEYTPVTK
jgi:hypothetical protein